MEKFRLFFILSRPYQWHKNVFVFAPLFFAGQLFTEKIFPVVLFFFNFILVSSSVYSLNDIFDYERDRLHKIKKNRPVASGKITKLEALVFSAICFAVSVAVSFYLGALVFILIYFVMNVVYSIYLKEKKPLDIFVVSLGFVIRILGGSAVADIPPSSWLIITTFFLAVFLSTMKREAELHSKIYERIGIISATLVVVSYSFYVVVEKRGIAAILSVFPVFYALLRYYIIVEEAENRDPSLLIFDREIILSVLIWGILIFFELYGQEFGFISF